MITSRLSMNVRSTSKSPIVTSAGRSLPWTSVAWFANTAFSASVARSMMAWLAVVSAM